ncbi:L,D-transpeptidase [Aquamicrobium sp. LC103]|uniref:L,D-transpeptidase family protein n=1 Tax=Aquamicrobium sp. LC103 TaxID=1120658 RepID=UPI00069C4691|nr:L,D-transpeptidase [Aquamicrobium sp. LC103]TKT75215.1 L,D-transpeptidase [Aquamicrobium sp. LC103]
MIARLLPFIAFAFLAPAMEAEARAFSGVAETDRVEDETTGLVQLAQAREVEIFYDRYGREVLVDIYTGEVVAIREPQESEFRSVEPPRSRGWGNPDAPPRDGYYVDRPDDSARSRREQRMRELGRGEPPQQPFPEYRDYGAGPEPYPEQPYPEQDDLAREEPGFQPPPISRDVERAPLGNDSAAITGPGSSPGAIIEEPGTGLPDVTAQPQPEVKGASEDVAKIQILLDRAGASPGVIDGRIGDNVNKAITAYREITGEALRTYDNEFIDAQLQATGGDAFTTYEITAVDAAGPFVASIPDDYGEKARMERMGFVSVTEMLAERFHMDENYLKALNPGVNFNRPGTIVRVANIGKQKTGEVTRIIADKGKKQVRAYGPDGRLVAIYPSTIGSQATPSPTGTHTVERIAVNPEYTYNPKINFKQGNNDRVLTIPPGPNGPVGTVWIALSKPTYGIHGTPEPSKIGKTNSNGCVRLTNWDAQELAKMVKVGATVEFVE